MGGQNTPTWSVRRPAELQHLECRNRVGQFQKKKNQSECRATSNDETCYRLQYRERHRSLPAVGGQKWPLLTSSVGDYRDIEIPDGSVIYCDIPYEGTNVYDKSVQFDYEAFYDWCSRQTQPLFISSYDMPADRFRCIEEFAHRSTLSASANNEVTERIFIPLHQQPPSRPVQLSLWG